MAAARKREEAAAQQERLREAYNELKYTAPDKVEAMRDQEMTRMQMSLAYRTGERLPPAKGLLAPRCDFAAALCHWITIGHAEPAADVACLQATVRRRSSWQVVSSPMSLSGSMGSCSSQRCKGLAPRM